MPTSPTAQYTDFSKDVIGRYVCNGLDEALRSTFGRPDARPFDIIIVGGGSFGGAAAQHLLYSDTFRNHRILVLDRRRLRHLRRPGDLLGSPCDPSGAFGHTAYCRPVAGGHCLSGRHP